MKKYTDGSVSTKLLAIILIASLLLGVGLSAFAAEQEPAGEPEIEETEAAEETAAEPEEVPEEPSETEAAADEPEETDVVEPADAQPEDPVIDEAPEADESEEEEEEPYLFGPISNEIIRRPRRRSPRCLTSRRTGSLRSGRVTVSFSPILRICCEYIRMMTTLGSSRWTTPGSSPKRSPWS